MWEYVRDPTVAAIFNEGIVSQRRIAEEESKLKAAERSRERELVEAQTALDVAKLQKDALDELGLEGQAAVDYMWIKALIELGKAPDVLILGGGGNVSVPFSPQQIQTPAAAQGQ